MYLTQEEIYPHSTGADCCAIIPPMVRGGCGLYPLAGAVGLLGMLVAIQKVQPSGYIIEIDGIL